MTRVELHGVLHSSETYEQLHSAMEKAGFTRTIEGSDGKKYKLPPAQYYASTTQTLEQVRDVAAKVASEVWRSYAVVTTEGSSAWQNLSSE